MARPVVWSDPAADDLEAAVSFVARDSEAYAKSLAQLAIDAAESLQVYPNRGHRLPDVKLSRFRELLIGSYRLIYLVEKDRVLLVAFVHGHRALRRALKGRSQESRASPNKRFKLTRLGWNWDAAWSAAYSRVCRHRRGWQQSARLAA